VDPGFLELASRALERVSPQARRRYLELLAARLSTLRAATRGAVARSWVRPSDAERRLARRVLRQIEGEWDDGDENLVRGWLDRWGTELSEPGAAARALLECVQQLTRIEPRPATIRFFLWEMESVLSGLLESAPPQPVPGRPEEAMPKRILVVDDDETILGLERMILEQKGFQVMTAAGGNRALELVTQQRFDLVLLDVMMPDKDGFEVCREIKRDARTRPIPVVFLTAKTGGEALAEGFEAGAVMYINKPFTATKLLAVVNTMLEQAAP
jgi:CheY-like chemotaxis protein